MIKNIIICENCFEENEDTRKTCKRCGLKLYKNEEYNSSNDNSDDVTEEILNKLNKPKDVKKVYSDNRYSNNNNNNSNKVADKFTLVVSIIKILGYLSAFILAIIIMCTDEDLILIGISVGIGIAIGTWLSTLTLEAIAEGLNLLQDIKNKL